MPWLNHASGNEHEIQLSGPGQDLWIVTALVESSRVLKMWNQKTITAPHSQSMGSLRRELGPRNADFIQKGRGPSSPPWVIWVIETKNCLRQLSFSEMARDLREPAGGLGKLKGSICPQAADKSPTPLSLSRMPRPKPATTWEQGFRTAVRNMVGNAGGWTVNDLRGRIQLKVRRSGQQGQAVTLPIPWTPGSQAAAIQLIGRLYQQVEGGHQSLRGALETLLASSDTMSKGTDWKAAADGLKGALMNGRNEIQLQTWRTNYQPYVEEALRILSSRNAPSDGHGLLQATLERWKGRAASRAACCIALRNLTAHAMARHHAPVYWTITPDIVKELRGKAPAKRTKAELSDEELIYLINGIDSRNPGWANVLRTLTLFGLRPIELQHLVPKKDEHGVLRMWCSYRKNCGGQLTEPRWLMPAPLTTSTSEHLDWNITGAIAVGLLELPECSDGGLRSLNGHYVGVFLQRQPEWKELAARCAARGEWLRPYVFRDSYSLRCHQRGIEIGAVADAMGHSVAVHASSYRWASVRTTVAAFERAFAD